MVAIVTGASDGIGFQTAKRLSELGYTVYGIARSAKAFPFMRYYTADVSEADTFASVLNEIYAREGRVDLLVVCAGVSLASPSDMTGMRDARYVFDVNFWGGVSAASHVMPWMKAAGGGRMVFVSSLTGAAPLPYLGFYSASKAALTAYASALRAEAAPFGVTVSTVAPGGVKTGFTDKRKKYLDLVGDPRAPGLGRALKAIRAIEQNGVAPARVARVILRMAAGTSTAGFATAGVLNRAVWLSLRLLPVRCVQAALRKLFVG